VGAAAVRLSQPAAPLGGGCEGDMRLWSSRRHQAADRGHGRRRWLQWCPGGLSGPSCRVRVRGSGAANFRSSGCLPVCRLCVATNSAFSALHFMYVVSSRNRRRHCIRHDRNRAGRPAVCRRLLRSGASRHHLHLNAFLSVRGLIYTDPKILSQNCKFSNVAAPLFLYILYSGTGTCYPIYPIYEIF